MPYIVPTEMPASCCTCRFADLKYHHPFWSREKPNTKGYVCCLDKQKRVLETHINDCDTKAEWCPLKDLKEYENELYKKADEA